MDAALADALREGRYVVDPRAVADAILARSGGDDRPPRLAAVLEALERDSRAGAVAKDDAPPRLDAA